VLILRKRIGVVTVDKIVRHDMRRYCIIYFREIAVVRKCFSVL